MSNQSLHIKIRRVNSNKTRNINSLARYGVARVLADLSVSPTVWLGTLDRPDHRRWIVLLRRLYTHIAVNSSLTHSVCDTFRRWLHISYMRYTFIFRSGKLRCRHNNIAEFSLRWTTSSFIDCVYKIAQSRRLYIDVSHTRSLTPSITMLHTHAHTHREHITRSRSRDNLYLWCVCVCALCVWFWAITLFCCESHA